jgi:glycerophosphoryl diester phosphodiesterase
VTSGALAAVLGCAFLLAVAGSAGAQRAPVSVIAAHRGGAALWPENSLLAFRNAAALGVAYLELDVHLSRDHETVVIHDATLDRTTTGTGPVRDRTLAELKSLRLKDAAGAVTGEPVPTLDEVVAVAATSGRQLLVEIKVGPGRVRYPGVEEGVVAVLDRHGMTDKAIVMAFEPETWRRVRQLRPGLRAGALYSARTLPAGSTVTRAIDEAREAGVWHVGLHHALVTPEVVRHAREAGLVLGAWTANEPDVMRRLIEQQVPIVTTDRPDVARSLRDEHESRRAR